MGISHTCWRQTKTKKQVMHMLAHAVGEKHPRTLDAMHQVGVVLQAQGRHGDAVEMHLHALARREESFGVDRPK